jgi:hypothetical protein
MVCFGVLQFSAILLDHIHHQWIYLDYILDYIHHQWIWSLVFTSPSPVAQGPVVFDTFLLNRGTQKADIRPVYSL